MSDVVMIQARQCHMNSLQSWFNDERELAQWGGPGLSLEVSPQQFAEQIALNGLHSFSLVLDGELMAFGQFYPRLNRNHLARLAVAPHQRGKQLSYQLVKGLHQQALQENLATGFSLYVLESNARAIGLYRNLGFEKAEYPGGMPADTAGHFYMTADVLYFPR